MSQIACIVSDNENVLITGNSEQLEALAHALLMKAKLKDKCSIVLKDVDSDALPINILHTDEIGSGLYVCVYRLKYVYDKKSRGWQSPVVEYFSTEHDRSNFINTFNPEYILEVIYTN